MIDIEDARKNALKMSLQLTLGSAALLLIAVCLHFSDGVTASGQPSWFSWLAVAYAAVSVPASTLIRSIMLSKAAAASPERMTPTFAGTAATMMFIGLAVAESGSLLGFVSYFVSGAIVPAVIAMAIGTIGISLHIPTRGRWESWTTITQDASAGIIRRT